MPSKLRILFRGPGNPRFICGNKAIAMLSQFVSKECLLTMQLPVDWSKRNKYSRLSFLAQLLPKGYELYLIREPKHTRKNKSLYLKMKDKGFKANTFPWKDLFIRDEMMFPPQQIIDLFIRDGVPHHVMGNARQGDQVWYQAVVPPVPPRIRRVR